MEVTPGPPAAAPQQPQLKRGQSARFCDVCYSKKEESSCISGGVFDHFLGAGGGLPAFLPLVVILFG